MITDSHTHTPRRGAIVNTEPGQPIDPSLYYSCGIHPWNTDKAGPEQWSALERTLSLPQVVAVGETGLDRLKGPSLAEQTEAFMRHARLAEKFHKPLIIHCVKAWPELIALKKKFNPTVPWIFHGFRLKPDVARRLTDAGFYLSFGHGFNPESVKACPIDRLLLESDEAEAIPLHIHTLKDVTESQLLEQLQKNNTFIFGVL